MKAYMRYLSLDFFKAIGIIYVVIIHQLIWFYLTGDGVVTSLKIKEAYDLGVLLLCRGLHVLGMQLPFLAGMAFYLSVVDKKLSWRYIFQRAFLLAVLGYLMNFWAWGLPDTFDWDVLQFVAFSMIISYGVLKYFPTIISMFLIGALSSAALLLSSQFPWVQFQSQYWYIIFFGSSSAEHYWPFCPWYALFGGGVLLAQVFRLHQKNFLFMSMVLGLVFLGVSIASGQFFPSSHVENAWGPALFKPSGYFVLGVLGFGFFAVSLMEFLVSRFPHVRRLCDNKTVLSFSHGILWIYLLTTVTGYPLTSYMAGSMNMTYPISLIIFMALIVIYLVASYYIGNLVMSYKFKLKEEK